jgi:hypothetical protein
MEGVRDLVDGLTPENAETILAQLAGLAEDPENSTILLGEVGIVELAMTVDARSHTPDARASAMWLLANLSNAEENVERIFETENIGSVVLGGMLESETPDVRAAALALVSNGAKNASVVSRLLESFPTLALDIVIGQHLPPGERRAVFALLLKFSLHTDALRIMNTDEVVAALVTKVRSDESVRDMAVALLARITSCVECRLSTLDRVSLVSFVRILDRSLFYKWPLSDVLTVLKRLCVEEANVAVFFSARLTPLLIQAFGESVDASNAGDAECATSCLQHFSFNSDARRVLRADSRLPGIIQRVTDSQWTKQLKVAAHNLGFQVYRSAGEPVAVLPPPRLGTWPLPKPIRTVEIKIWLFWAGLGTLFEPISQQHAHKWADIVTWPANQLASKLHIGTEAAQKLAAAFEDMKWNVV